MDSIWQDIRHGIRALAKTPGLTLGAMLILAFGISSNTANFSMANTYLLRAPHFAEPDRLVHVWETDTRRGFERIRASLPNYLDWKANNQVFADMAVFNYTGENLVGPDGPERVNAGRVSANVFDLLGVKPILGRGFETGEDQPGRGDVVVLSYRFWQQRFGGRADALGQTMQLNNRTYTVVGVMPQDFAFPLLTTQLWAPRELNPATAPRELRFLQVAARLKPGVTIGQAQVAMNAIAKGLSAEYPQSNKDSGINLRPLHQELNFAYDVLSVVLSVLGVASFLLLLVSCANVANLLMARALSRVREIAIRAALGAGRLRVIRQLLTESLLLSVTGGALGVLLAHWTLRGMARMIPDDLYRVGDLQMDPAGLAFTAGLCLLTALIFGLAPALQISRPNLTEALKEGSQGADTGRKRHRLHRMLTVSQVSLGLILLSSAALMMRAFVELKNSDLGFATANVLTMQITLPRAQYPGVEQRAAFHRQVIQEAQAVPGVLAAATVNYLPLNHETDVNEVLLEPQAPASGGQGRTASALWVTPDYFKATGVALRKGRAFTDQDRADSQPVVIVNEALAQRYFPGQDALGRTVYLKSIGEEKTQPVQIVGVAGNIRYGDEFEGIFPLQIYRPQYQEPWSYFRLVAHTVGAPATIAPALRDAVWRVDAKLPIVEVRTMEEVVAASLLPRRVMTVSLAIFASVALALAAVGLYGIMSTWVAQRTREIGVRVALGARRSDILSLVLRQGVMLVVIGAALGLAGSFGVAKLLTSILTGLQLFDPLAFVGGPLLLVAVALLACWVPARRALRVNPIQALHYE